MADSANKAEAASCYQCLGKRRRCPRKMQNAARPIGQALARNGRD